MSSTPKPLISLCMIVRDEESWLARCLESVRRLVDEIVVVDTGSTDRTPEIAGRFGARVFAHPWQGDFSLHRNQSLDYATGSWVLMMDADEIIAGKDLPRIRQLAERPQADGYRLILRNYETDLNLANVALNPGDYEEGTGFPGFIPVPLIRLFRQDPRVRFSGAVHESVQESFDRQGLRSADTDIPIHHYGKAIAERRSRKREIYRKLGEKRLEDRPDDPAAYKVLSDQYLESGLPKEALDILERGLERFPGLVDLRFNRGLALDRMGRPEEAKREYLAVLRHEPGHTGACHNLGQIYLAGNRLREALDILCKGTGRGGIRHPAVYLLLGRVCLAAGLWNEALANFDRLLDTRARYPDVHCHRALALLNVGRFDEAVTALETEIASGGNAAGAYRLLGELSLRLGDRESARLFFQKALSHRPGDPAARTYLEQIEPGHPDPRR